MKFSPRLPGAILGATAALVIVQPQIATAALTVEELNQLSQEITVLIERKDSPSNSGSGVIIAQEGNNYTVLTAYHVVKAGVSRGDLEYGIITHNDREYKLDLNTIEKLPGVDLALLQFTSSEQYRVATLGDYDLRTEGAGRSSLIFVSGWPAGWEEARRLFNPGLRIAEEFASAFAKKTLAEGYEMLYTSITYPGMSGGPVLDVNGNVIGIHGQSEGERISETEAGTNNFRVRLGYSLGIPIQTFLNLAKEEGNLPETLAIANTPPVNLSRTEMLDSLESWQPERPKGEAAEDKRAWVNYGNELWRISRVYADANPEDSRTIALRKKAVAGYEEALKIDPEFYQAWYARGNALSDMGEEEAALSSYDRAIELLDYERLTAEYEKAIESNNERQKLELEAELELYATLWRYKGVMLSNLQRYEAARDALIKVTKIQEDDFAAWDLLGMAQLELGAKEEALKSFEKSLAINDEYVYAWLHKGDVLAKLGQFNESLIAYEKAVELQPNLYFAVFRRGEVLAKILQDTQQSPQALDEALSIDARDPHGLHRRGFAWFGLTNREAAIATFDRAIESNPDDALAWAARGLALVVENRYEEAQAAFERALELNPNDFETQEVLQLLEQVQQLDDSDSELRGMER